MSAEKIDILMVDDDPGACRLVKLILAESRQPVEFVIESAGTLAEGLDALAGHSFDLVLLDLGLPDSDGLHTVDRMYKACPHIPIVVLTGLADEEAGVQAIKKGASDYLVKGRFFRDMLVRTIRYSLERKEVERKLQLATERYRTIFENSAVAIMLVDEQERLVSWNKRTKTLLDMEKEDLYAKPVKSLYPAEEWEKIRANNSKRKGMQHHLETKVIKKSGEVIDVDVSLSVLKDSKGNTTGSISVISDITERKRTEENLKIAKEQAESAWIELEQLNLQLEASVERANLMTQEAVMANQAKSQFLANMSHEIRTPMNGVLGMLELALDEPLSDKVADYLRNAKLSADTLLTIIDDILDISKIEAGKISIEIIECSLKQLLSDIDALMCPQAEQKGIKFTISIDTPVPEQIRTDPTRLRQCLLNLLGNAVKFTDTGYVRIHIAGQGDKERATIRFDVEDTGIGIEPDKQKLIFEAFTQSDSTTTRKFGGTGLGLVITRNLVKLLGGTISLTSKPGKGSTFSLIVPAGVYIGTQPLITEFNRDQTRAKGASAVSVKFAGKILVVEDDSVNQKTILAILKKVGLEADVANDGEQAVKKATDEHFDLILMDMNMPNLNGYEATKALRKKGLTISIIALTASVMKSDSDKCLAVGCDQYLAKPIDRKKFFETLAGYLPLPDYVIDWPELEDRIGDEQLIKEIISGFLADNTKRVELLTEAVKAANLEDIKMLSHALKGSAATVAAKPLSQAACQLNLAAKANNLETPESLLADIQAEFDKLKTLLAQPDWIQIVKEKTKSAE